MKRSKLTGTIAVLVFALPLFGAGSLYGQPFDVLSYSIDGGGGISNAGVFEMQGLMGQVDAGPPLTGGSFTMTGGVLPPDEDAILLGDVNGDGEVNLLDVAPFVTAIANGTFIPEADINQDGTVDLLDVAPFVELLSG